MKDFLLDRARRERIGISEAILCEGKTVDQIEAIIADGPSLTQPLMLTRLDAHVFAALPAQSRDRFDYDPVSRTAVRGPGAKPQHPPRTAVITAGTSDRGAAREAVRTLAFHGEAALEVHDVGVAGLWRLLDRLEEIRSHPVVIVAAGMDGALFSVVGGLVPGVVIALPTDRGYGIAAGGQTALGTALSSCAPGVAVVNIGNGYGAACIALRALHGRAVALGLNKQTVEIAE